MKFTPKRIERVLLIVNPASRRAARLRHRVVNAFANAGVECEFMLTEAPGSAATIAKTHAHEYDAVFTLGGDGTVMEVLGALAHHGPLKLCRRCSQRKTSENTNRKIHQPTVGSLGQDPGAPVPRSGLGLVGWEFSVRIKALD